MKWWGWVLAFLPAGAGIMLSIFSQNEILLSNPVLFLRGNLSTLVFRLGITISALIIASIFLLERMKKKQKMNIYKIRSDAVEERRRFLQRLDHELKNPLTAIQTGLSNIDQFAVEDQKEEVSAVRTQVLRVSRLVADLRKLAALETMPIEEIEVNLNEILQEVVSTAKIQYADSRSEITLIIPNAPWPLPNIKGDPDLLLLAVHNLLDNAIKFSQPLDTIEVRAYEDENTVVIEVADTGPGIPDSEVGQVWEELFRGEHARGIPGSGLGLPLVRAIVQLHGGQVSLRSRPNQGTVINIKLPTS
jgi:two-component system OmpR family sensor kinase